MSFSGFMFGLMAGKSDAKRDSTLTEPAEVEAVKNINYMGNNDKWNLLDVYYPRGTEGKLPVIISYHGGGYVYGTKEIYKFYGMYMASLGFVFINYNYHLAPKNKFPMQLTETNHVIEWCIKNSDQYHMDMNNVFMVGDSAGAQMASHYAAIYANPQFASLYPFTVPSGFKLRALGLNCGLYSVKASDDNSKMTADLRKDYLGKDLAKYGKMLDVLEYIDENYPPSYIMTSYYDFLKENAEPLYNYLREKGVEAQWKCYGTEDKKYMAHVCHVNMNLEEAKEINRDEAEFFRKYISG